MAIDWPKFWTTLFEAGLTGVISAVTIYFAFILGKRQAEKEIREQSIRDLTNKRINILKELIDFRPLLVSRAGYVYMHRGNYFLDDEEKHKILTTAILALGLFQSGDCLDVVTALNKLTSVTNWDIKVPDTKEKTLEKIVSRSSALEEIFPVLLNKQLELNKKKFAK